MAVRVRLMARTGQIDTSLANKMGSAPPAGKGQIWDSDKGPVVWAVSTSCGPRKRLQPNCHVRIELAMFKGSKADSRARLLSE